MSLDLHPYLLVYLSTCLLRFIEQGVIFYRMSSFDRSIKPVALFQRGLSAFAIGQQLVVEQVKIPIHQLHPALEGFKIVQLSDFHLDPFFQIEMLRTAVSMVNALQPDLVVLTGDYVTKIGDAIFELAPLLAGLNARYGVYASLGNHDVRSRAKVIKSGLRQARLPLLVNAGLPITVGQGQLYLAGLDDGLWGRPSLKEALINCPPATPVILLAHEPDLVDQVATDVRVALQLSGHTHGGQIRLPGLGALTLPSLGSKYVQGLYRVRSTWLYTNRGIGSIRIPVRMNCQPEITEITLVAGA